jgi:hypothetical protein
MSVFLQCPKCGSTIVHVYEFLNIERVFQSLDPDKMWDEMEIVHEEPTGEPLLFQCQYRNCLHEWNEPPYHTRIDELVGNNG